MRSQLVCFKCMAKFAELMCFSIVSSVHIKKLYTLIAENEILEFAFESKW